MVEQHRYLKAKVPDSQCCIYSVTEICLTPIKTAGLSSREEKFRSYAHIFNIQINGGLQ